MGVVLGVQDEPGMQAGVEGQFQEDVLLAEVGHLVRPYAEGSAGRFPAQGWQSGVLIPASRAMHATATRRRPSTCAEVSRRVYAGIDRRDVRTILRRIERAR